MLFSQKSDRFLTSQPYDMMVEEHPECKEWVKGDVNDNNVEPTVKTSTKPTSRGLQSFVLITDQS